MDMKFELKSQSKKSKEQYSYLESSGLEEKKGFQLYKKIECLEYEIKKLRCENDELKKINKVLTNKIDLLVNNNTIVKNVKNEMNDCSQISHINNEDTLKEFFFLLVICEKMNYLNQDKIWTIDSNHLYKLVLKNDLAFYEWPSFIKNKILEEYERSLIKVEGGGQRKNQTGILATIK